MRLVVHDYAGHAFTVQLSRALAKRGHQVLHAYCSSFQGPKGPLTATPSDPDSWKVAALSPPGDFAKYSFTRRALQEWRYANLISNEVSRFKPEAVVSVAPPLVQYLLARRCAAERIRLAVWVQDLYGVAIRQILGRQSRLLGAGAGAVFESLERRATKNAYRVIPITHDFQPFLDCWKIRRDVVKVIPNWAPLAALPMKPKRNEWAIKMGLEDRVCLLYSGTMGMKHNPEMLLALAQNIPSEHSVVVVSEGLGADYLQRESQLRNITNLVVVGFQPFEEMPNVLATADVLVAMLEPDAGVYSVPSKVLAYMCAGRPTLLGVPSENLAARLVRDNDAGLVVDPTDRAAWCRAANRLIADVAGRARMAANARAYAEAQFDIERITTQFEEVLAP